MSGQPRRGGRAGEHHVAGVELEGVRQVLDQRRHREDHLRGASELDELAVDAGLEREIVRIGELVDRHQRRPDRGEPSMRLGETELRNRSGQLSPAVGQVLSDRQSRDGLPCPIGRDVAATSADHDHEFDLPVHRVRGKGHGGDRAGDRRGELGEDHRRLGLFHTGLRRVVGIVQADGEHLARAGTGEPSRPGSIPPRCAGVTLSRLPVYQVTNSAHRS